MWGGGGDWRVLVRPGPPAALGSWEVGLVAVAPGSFHCRRRPKSYSSDSVLSNVPARLCCRVDGRGRRGLVTEVENRRGASILYGSYTIQMYKEYDVIWS